MNVRLSLTRPLALVVLAAVALGVVGACGDDPTPTPAPTPTPTPSPFMSLPADAVWGDVVGLLAEPEQQCLRDSAGTSFDAQLATPVFGSVGSYLSDIFVPCLPPETVVDLVVANLSHQAGGLSGDSAACIRGTFSNVDLRAVFEATEGSQGEARAAFGSVLGTLLCLNDDEASRISVSGLFDAAEAGLSLQDLRCVVQRVDIAVLLDLFVPAGPDAPPPDLSRTVELLAALQECGVNLEELGGGPPSPPASGLPGVPDAPGGTDDSEVVDIEDLPPELQEALACLVNMLGEEKIAALLEGTYTPTSTDMEALSTCELDIPRIFELLAEMEQ